MQSEVNIVQLSFALLFIFGGLIFLNLSQRVGKRITHIEVIFPNDREYQSKTNIRNTHVKKLVLEWRILVLFEIGVTSLGGFLAVGYVGLLFFCTIILISYYVDRGKIPDANYDPLVNLANTIVMVDVHGNISLHNARNSIINFIQTRKLSQKEMAQLLTHLLESKVITSDIAFDVRRNLSIAV